MAKTSQKRVTKKIRNRIIELHLQDMGTYDIAEQIYKEEMDLSSGAVDKIIREYYNSIGKERIRRNPKTKKTIYTIEEIEEQLLKQLEKGRPVEEVYRIAKKMNSLTDNLLAVIKNKGYNIPDKIEEENERWIK